MGRLDRGWQVRPEAQFNIDRPPSYYQKKLCYGTVVMSEPALRFLIDALDIDHIVLGSDYPFVGWDPSPGGLLGSCE